MATATKPRAKKSEAKLTDQQREEAIQAVLNGKVGIEQVPIRVMIRKCGNRKDASYFLSRQLIWQQGRDVAGENVLDAQGIGLWCKMADGATEMIPWDEVIDEAIDGDAGVESWDPPAPPRQVKSSTNPSLKRAAPGSTVLTAKGPVTVPDPAATDHGGKSTSLPDGIRRFDPAAVAASSSSTSAAKPIAADVETGPTYLSPDDIEPNPFQPRREFDQAELASLAESIRLNSQAQAILVRPTPDFPQRKGSKRYQLVAGERRTRACKLADLNVRAEIRVLTDAQSADIALVENLQRKDLNDVEKALAYQAEIDSGRHTNKSLAAKIGVTHGEISNTIRLLQLPEAWQQKIVSQEIPPTHARYVLPFADCPAVLKDLEDDLKHKQTAGTVKQWRQLIGHAAKANSRPMKGDREEHIEGYGWVTVRFKPTAEELEQLQIKEVSLIDWQGKETKKERAFNLPLWDRLHRAAQEKYEANQAKRAAKQGKTSSSSSSRPTIDPEKVYADRVHRWRIDRLQQLCANRLAEPLDELKEPGRALPLKAIVYLAGYHGCDPGYAIGEVIEAKVGKSSRCILDRERIYAELSAFAIDDLPQAIVDVIRRLLWDDVEGPNGTFPDAIVEQLAADLEIDFSTLWHDAGGPQTEAFFSLHTKDKLEALAAELKIHLEPGKSKGQMIQVMIGGMKAGKNVPCPKVLQAKKKGSK